MDSIKNIDNKISDIVDNNLKEKTKSMVFFKQICYELLCTINLKDNLNYNKF